MCIRDSSRHTLQRAVQLGEGVLDLLSGLADVQPLTDADDRYDPLPEGGSRLRRHRRVILGVVLPALGVADRDVRRTELRQHHRGDLPGVRTVGVCRHVLGAVTDLQLVRVHQGLHGTQVGERHQYGDLDGGEVVLGVLERPGELLDQMGGLVVVQVHLPVARHQRGAGHQSSNTAMPGRALPSRSSRLAPPPVEMCPKPASSKPRRRTAAAVSPPPTIEKAPALPASMMAWATARVPAAKGSISKTPGGPFHTMVFASASLAAKRAAESGPMSRPIRPSGIASAGTTSCAASAAKASATTMSVGSTISTPAAVACSR